MGTGLIGRVEELGEIEALIDRITAGPAGLVIAGEPGIGKTALWETGVDRARRAGRRVLACRCVEAEASVSMAALSDLIEPVFNEVAGSLTAPRRHALEIALLLGEPGSRRVDLRGIALAVLDVLGALAMRQPVIVGVDDIQWLDTASALIVSMAMRRLGSSRVGLLATLRDARNVKAPFDFEQSFPNGRLTRISLGALSLGALHHVLRERLGLNLARPELLRVHAATRGNAFYAMELARESLRTGWRIDARRPLPVPDDLAALLSRRLGRLPSSTQELLVAVAALQRPTLELLATSRRGPARTRDLLEPAEREGVIEIGPGRVRFTHPLLASVCYQQASAATRRAVHARLADAVQGSEEGARHLGLSVDGTDAAVAERLEAAADAAEARSVIAAAELMALAAEVTPKALADNWRRRWRRAGWLYLHAGAAENAVAILERILPYLPPGDDRSDVRYWLVTSVLPNTLPEIADRLRRASAEAEDDQRLRARTLTVASSYRLYFDPHGALVEARAALFEAEQAGDDRSIARAIARLGYVETWTLDMTPGLLERGLALEEQLHGQPFMFHDSPSVILGLRLMVRDELERARMILEPKTAMASDAMRAYALVFMVTLDWLSDNWQDALDHARAAIELAEQVDHEVVRGWALQAVALVEAHLGRAEEANSHATESIAIARAVGDQITLIRNEGVLGHVALASGNVDKAVRHLATAPGRLVELGWNETSSTVWADAAEALTAAGNLLGARHALHLYNERAWRSGRRSRASSARCSGLLAAAEGRLDEAFSDFAKAERELKGLPYAFERGRLLLACGSAYRQARQQRAARQALEQAQAIFAGLGATLWEARAAEEIRRVGGRRAAPGRMTETELRIATLASRGRANKEIAAALFMSVHTVESHLTHLYRKLGVRSRGELSSRLLASPEQGPKT
jgi:DNA-binding CsgD family transcriptional regulator